ncbi:hypothetical protein RhiirA4_489912 [Rhizophagus irregularis]|uniref:Uncharacterized protein n=1 Tax=Rhizophagus irregularis TaxID=588596 RepID=A0A2I1HVB0_9GLOM|nr:hypothetical protein RhiirA4_489912 [Rhizophagus irregularis]
MDDEIVVLDNEIVVPIHFDNVTENHSSGNKESEESDTDDEIVNINEVTLKIGDLFNDWESVQFIQEHNHQCDPKTIEFAPKNLRLPQQIIDKIKHYTTNGNLGAG